jgi:hypothetical protein
MVDGSMVHRLSPADLMPIILQRGSLSNRAKTKDNLSKKETRFSTVGTLLEQWFIPRRRRYTWVWSKGLDFRGLASAKNHSSPYDWMIDFLLLDEQDRECGLSLLERISTDGEELEAEKIFLRLSAESRLVDAAKEAGFSHYVTECLYQLEKEKGDLMDKGGELPIPLRYKHSGDEYRLFELYEACVPVPVRRVEGMTFTEWQATKDKDATQQGKEWVYEKEGSLVGLFRASIIRDSGQFEIMAHSDEELEQMVEYSLKYLKNCRYLFCLTPEFQHELKRLLENQGFVEVAKYSALVKELAIRAQQPCLIPLQA